MKTFKYLIAIFILTFIPKQLLIVVARTVADVIQIIKRVIIIVIKPSRC